MATESPLIHDGSQFTLSTALDFRNSTTTGSTLSGPNGSQFLAVAISTVARTCIIASTAASGGRMYGICQNKPGPGVAIDVGIFGISKCVAGATITPGQQLEVSSTALGTLIAYSSGAGAYPVGQSIEAAVVGQVFSAVIYGCTPAGGY